MEPQQLDSDDERLRIEHPFRWRWWKIAAVLDRLDTRIRSWIAGA